MLNYFPGRHGQTVTKAKTGIKHNTFNKTIILQYQLAGSISTSNNNSDTCGIYKHTGKERDKESDYDYFGARYYDADLGRWHSVDPLADKYYGWSPYTYSLNNSIRNVDTDGRFVVDGNRIIFSSRLEFFIELFKWDIYGYSKDNLFGDATYERARDLFTSILSGGLEEALGGVAPLTGKVNGVSDKADFISTQNDRETEWHAEQKLYEVIRNIADEDGVPVFVPQALLDGDKKYQPEKYRVNGKLLIINDDYLNKYKRYGNKQMLIKGLVYRLIQMRVSIYNALKNEQLKWKKIYAPENN